jgi:hypothetical protein
MAIFDLLSFLEKSGGSPPPSKMVGLAFLLLKIEFSPSNPSNPNSEKIIASFKVLS